ncbi:type II secretion system protein [Hyphomonas polymorpha PS728]|uniref:Type II secretion system protein n=1 Tax=Hyphomonas polymorpha PS728 TaxID=1280954 RepID=A0A062VQQ7_9PROT|nr:type II secretion system F family protein [Hyphomonas polymorpha]KDA00624.1 type II secretion system protein [Hyphomonas polymorpha PS728]
MPVYRFRALNPQGKAVDGRQAGATRDEAYERIRARGLHPVDLSEVRGRRRRRSSSRLDRKLLLRTVRQLATLLSAGVPLLEAVDNLRRSDAEGEVGSRFARLSQHLRQGERLSAGLREHFAELPDYVISLTALGEATGQLPRTLSDAADRMDADAALASELRSALSYPVVLASVGAFIILGMFIFVIPRFGSLVERSGADIPAMSRWVIDSGVWLSSNWLVFLVCAGGLFFLLRRVLAGNTERVRAAAARLPGFGAVMRRVDLENWSRTLGVALANGAQLMPALDLAARTVKSREFAAQLEGVRRDVRGGAHLDEAFETNVLGADAMLLDLMATGRKSGTLDRMLVLAADSYREEITAMTKRLTSIAEPVAILVVSLIVGTLVVSIVLAMTSLYDFDI